MSGGGQDALAKRRPPDTAATRHLCAAVYLDERFRRTCLSEIYLKAKKVTAPSYGFRLLPVLWQCRLAGSVMLIRDLLVLLIFSATVAIEPMSAVWLLAGTFGLHVIVAWVEFIYDTDRELRRRALPRLRWWGRAIALAAGAPLALVATLLPSQPGALLPLLIMVVVAGSVEVWWQRQTRRFAPGVVIDDPPPTSRTELIRRQQESNTVIYATDPFIGSGEVIDTWGFALRLVRLDPTYGGEGGVPREFDTLPFTAEDLVAHVKSELAELLSDRDTAHFYPGLTVHDRVFRIGTESDRLAPVTGPEEMAAIIRQPTSSARHYLACQVVGWGGELVTTVYVHIALQGRSLYLELTTTGLPSCDERFRVVDQVDEMKVSDYLHALYRGVVKAPFTVLAAVPRLVLRLIDAVRTPSEVPADSVPLGYNYGAELSVRELACQTDLEDHVQEQEILKHKRVIERRVVALVLDFLEEHDVDTDEYRQRTVTVLNAGAVNLGSGSINVRTAVGKQK